MGTAALVLLSVCYGTSADAVYALTIWPAWVWLGFGAPTAALAWRTSKTGGKGLVIAWVVFLLAFAEEPMSLLRSLAMGGAEAGANRIVSLNCAGGDPLAMLEALGTSPQLVLLQESPPRTDIERVLGAEWSTVVGPDASIVAVGKLEQLLIPRWTDNFVAARWWRPGSKVPVYVVSLRLEPPVLRFDYWNVECWRAYARSKRKRRAELAEVVAYVATLPKGSAAIVGGDFNTPPDRSITASLAADFVDVFAKSGSGWGATGINDYPLVRIDQIWVRGGTPATARATKTENSDHRMVEAEVVFP